MATRGRLRGSDPGLRGGLSAERAPSRRTGETGPARPALDGSGTRFQAGSRVSASRPVSKRGSVTIPNKTRPVDAERRGGGNDAGGLSPRRTERREARDVGRCSPPAGASSSQTGTRRTRGLHVRLGAGGPSERSAWSPAVRAGAPRARLSGSSGRGVGSQGRHCGPPARARCRGQRHTRGRRTSRPQTLPARGRVQNPRPNPRAEVSEGGVRTRPTRALAPTGVENATCGLGKAWDRHQEGKRWLGA